MGKKQASNNFSGTPGQQKQLSQRKRQDGKEWVDRNASARSRRKPEKRA